MNKKLLAVSLALFAMLAMGVRYYGENLQFAKTTSLTTCAVGTLGATTMMLGGANEGASKLCVCKSDGAASPAYAWCSITLSQLAVVVCTGGSTTVCP